MIRSLKLILGRYRENVSYIYQRHLMCDGAQMAAPGFSSTGFTGTDSSDDVYLLCYAID